MKARGHMLRSGAQAARSGSSVVKQLKPTTNDTAFGPASTAQSDPVGVDGPSHQATTTYSQHEPPTSNCGAGNPAESPEKCPVGFPNVSTPPVAYHSSEW